MSNAIPNQDYFALLGLPRRFSIDMVNLEREYLKRSMEFHPDFHAEDSPEEQSHNERLAAVLNEAYRVLSDPFRRADYLVQLSGGPSANELKAMPQAFLMEMLDLRERIELAKQAPESPDQTQLSIDLESRLTATMESVRLLYEQSPVSLKAIREQLNVAKYLRGLIRDLSTPNPG